MAHVNKVKKLKSELRETVNKLLQQGESIDTVTAFLRGEGENISRSSVGRYRVEWQEAVKDIEEARAFAEMTIEKLAAQGEDKVAILNAKMFESAFYSILNKIRIMEKNDEDIEVVVRLYERMAKAHKNVSSAHAADVDTTIKKNDYALDTELSKTEDAKKSSVTVKFA